MHLFSIQKKKKRTAKKTKKKTQQEIRNFLALSQVEDFFKVLQTKKQTNRKQANKQKTTKLQKINKKGKYEKTFIMLTENLSN